MYQTKETIVETELEAIDELNVIHAMLKGMAAILTAMIEDASYPTEEGLWFLSNNLYYCSDVMKLSSDLIYKEYRKRSSNKVCTTSTRNDISTQSRVKGDKAA